MLGSVLSSRILGLSSFLTTLLLSVKISNQSVYYPGSHLHTQSQQGSVPNMIEDPVVQLVMQFLMFHNHSGTAALEEAVGSIPSTQVIRDLKWSAKDDGNHTDASEDEDYELEDGADTTHNEDKDNDKCDPTDVKEGASEGVSESGVDLQTRLKELAGGGIVSVAIFGLSVVGMYLQQ